MFFHKAVDHSIDPLQNSVTTPSCDMETRLVVQNTKFLVFLFRSLKSEQTGFAAVFYPF